MNFRERVVRDLYADAIRRLDELEEGDFDAAHGEADRILLECVPPEIAAAYERARERCGPFHTA